MKLLMALARYKKILRLAEDIVRICYSDRGMWAGKEAITRNQDFIVKVHELGVALGIFKPMKEVR